MAHIPVFKNEIIENLNVKSDGIYVDLTLGGGGHARAILEKLTTGKLIAFDVDQDAIANFDKKAILVNKSFTKLTETLAELGIEKVDGIIADLGWSTDQLSSISGLAYDTEGEMELDMRLDQSMQAKASDLLNGMYKPELLGMFEKYADIRGNEAKRLVEGIFEFRRQQPIRTNQDLLTIIYSTLPSASRRGSRGFSQPVKPGNAGNLPARVFQALRIAVNDELSRLQSVLPQALDALSAGGSLQVISFHSGEDRIVKHQFHRWVAEVKAEYLYEEEYLHPSVEELTQNLRARSAKLRGVKKL
jgi:16S rRNA (cytosine1402-N4)-methyltransferase